MSNGLEIFYCSVISTFLISCWVLCHIYKAPMKRLGRLRDFRESLDSGSLQPYMPGLSTSFMFFTIYIYLGLHSPAFFQEFRTISCSNWKTVK